MLRGAFDIRRALFLPVIGVAGLVAGSVAGCGGHAHGAAPVDHTSAANSTGHDVAGTRDSAEHDWLCFVLIPSPTSPAAGSVTHLKQRRTKQGGLEFVSVWDQQGRRGVTRMDFHLVDDLLRAELGGGTAVMGLSDDPATPASSRMYYSNPARGLLFTETAVQTGDHLTIDSADGFPGQQGPTTRQTFRRTECFIVDAAVKAADAGSSRDAPVVGD